MKEKILITGGTGLVGEKLTPLLLQAGYAVGILTRGASRKENDIHYYNWDIRKGEIDPEAFQDVSYIINLVGAGVADEKWTEKRKSVIMDSRTESTGLLFDIIKERKIDLKGFISASAIGIYGNFEGADVKTESSQHGNDFLAEVVIAWEKEANKFNSLNIRTVLMRIGVVLDSAGGALEKIAQPIRYGVGAPLGSGDQFMSWVHIDDLCNMFLWAIQNDSVEGPFNAVNPHPVTNREFTKAVAKTLKKPLLLPNVPSFVLKLMLGEMSSIVLGGSVISDQKLKDHGFKHQYEQLIPALENLLKK
ncbi:MAG: TIGR01777 family oxidoreductase [Bacteroidota bacterium]